jgi:hypothetical protein
MKIVEERPTASVWYNDDTRAKTFEIEEDAHTPSYRFDRKATEYKSFAERGSWDDRTLAFCVLHETMRYANLDPMGGRRP